jgi:hypothetical protein
VQNSRQGEDFRKQKGRNASHEGFTEYHWLYPRMLQPRRNEKAVSDLCAGRSNGAVRKADAKRDD